MESTSPAATSVLALVASAVSADAPAAPPARASFNHLPAEVCSTIVKLARVQDKGLKKMDLPGGGTIAALSLVNKRLRQLALPYLITVSPPLVRASSRSLIQQSLALFCPTQKVTGWQLQSTTFRYGKIPKSLLAQIRCLDLGAVDESDTLAAAQSLHLLENIHELVLSRDASQVLFGTHLDRDEPFRHTEEHPFAQDAFKNRATSITRLVQSESYDPYQCGVRMLLKAVSVPAALKKLHLRQPPGPSTFFTPHSISLRLILAGLDALEELIIEEEAAVQSDIPESFRTAWIGDMRLPALKTLKLPATSFAVLDLVKAWVPNISKLTVDFMPNRHGPIWEGLDADRCCCFSSLRKLSLLGPLNVFRALKYLDLPCLQELKIKVKTTAVCDGDFVDFDPSKVILKCACRTGCDFTCTCLTRRRSGRSTGNPSATTAPTAALPLCCTRPTAPRAFKRGFLASGAFATETIARERYAAIAAVLRATAERLQWLKSLQDVAGLRQLAEAMSNLALLEWASRV
ncbi:hypothetical protein JCM3774_001655 [Rhodotorula dairenensis]